MTLPGYRPAVDMTSVEESIAHWADSGAMALTRCGSGAPSVLPAPLATAMLRWSDQLASTTADWGTRVEIDGPALLGERAAIHKFGPRDCRGTGRHESVGGGAKFVRVADGWMALSLPRPEDVEALPALVGADIDASDWPAVAGAMSRIDSRELIERGSLLGMALAGFHEQPPPSAVRVFSEGAKRRPRPHPLVIDMTSLWAGPLAASLVRSAGARVVKVESASRPDGARLGHREFFDLLNGGKRCLSVDFSNREDISFLQSLISVADLVIESSRPRAMRQVGIIAESIVASGVGWLSITAHGRGRHGGLRIGFGDDAAVAGGLWLGEHSPMFVADAVADPMTGLRAGVEAARMLGSERSRGVDISLAGVAASVEMLDETSVDARLINRVGSRWRTPRARRADVRAGALGADNRSVRAELVADLPPDSENLSVGGGN